MSLATCVAGKTPMLEPFLYLCKLPPARAPYPNSERRGTRELCYLFVVIILWQMNCESGFRTTDS